MLRNGIKTLNLLNGKLPPYTSPLTARCYLNFWIHHSLIIILPFSSLPLSHSPLLPFAWALGTWQFTKIFETVLEYYSDKKFGNRSEANYERFLFVKTEYRYERVDIDSILYIEGMKDYLRIVCTDKKIMTLQNFSKLEESLPADCFCRIHKSFMVAINKIRSVERGVVVIGETRIPVSITYRNIVFLIKSG